MQPATATPGTGMPPEWLALLVRHGAVVENGRVLHYGKPEAERRAAAEGDVIADLSHLSLLRADGADTQGFLQGQLSNDIRQVTENRAQLSAYCNAKGRMLAIFQICKRGESYYLQLPAALAETTFKRLRMFVLRAKVKLDLADAEPARLGLSGPNAETLLRTVLGNPPASPWDCHGDGEVTVIRLPGPHPRFELLAPPARLAALWERFAASAAPVGAGAWAWLDIQAGLPTVLPGTVEEFVPQMANLELVGGVSFTKGCYPGQEIVARMHYLGRLKQRMYRAHASLDAPPAPGSPLYAPDFPGQSAGSVVDAQRSPRGGVDLLVVLQIASAARGEAHLAEPNGPSLQLEPLPYALPDAG